MTRFSKQQIATAIAAFFHAVGVLGILFGNAAWFISLTPYNLLLSFILILYTHTGVNKKLLFFFAITFVFGILVEIIGTKTGYLFGNYAYGNVLGIKTFGVPVILGINWFIVMYCAGITMWLLLLRSAKALDSFDPAQVKWLKLLSLVVDGALLAVFFDWLMEPVAVKLDFWQWAEGEIPLFNYICWFAVSMLFLLLFHKLKLAQPNKFGLHVLLIQAMFFLLLRAFL